VSKERTKLEVFALAVQVLAREEERFHVRANLQSSGLVAAVLTYLGRDEAGDLLQQIERQYADFQAEVRWSTREAPTMSVAWRLDPLGHLEGEARVQDDSEGWSATVRIRGDQSYLPRVALGLRLLLR
jgi:hypothetical protein